MSDLLYDTFKEYSRIEEAIVVTEEGIYSKDGVPDSYGGAQLEVKVVHTVNMVNLAGVMLTLEFHNEAPRNKDKSSKIRPITVDGSAPISPANGSYKDNDGVTRDGETRKWVTVKSTMIHSAAKANGDITAGIRNLPTA